MKKKQSILKKKVQTGIVCLLLAAMMLPLFTLPAQAAVKKINISKASVVLSYTTAEYSGAAKKPAVTVKYHKTRLKRKKDYTVTYRYNENVGKAVVTIKGKGRFSGTVRKTFKIKPKSVPITSLSAGSNRFEVRWKKQTKQSQGYQLQYSTDKKFSSGSKTRLILDNSVTKWEVTGLKSDTVYYVRLRTVKYVKNKFWYSAWSKAKKIKTPVQAESGDSLAEKNADIALQILRERMQSEGTCNSLISPFSLYEDLAMAANGANGQTLQELENYLGGEIASINSSIAACNQSLPSSVQTANSIWINELFGAVDPDFKAQTEEAYQARIESLPYNDDTVTLINNWVSENTKQMIPRLVETLGPDEVMHLINAVAFEADWKKKYEPENIHTERFLNADKSESKCTMLRSTETEYVDLTDAKGNTIAYGFLKPYKDDQTAFLGLLPTKDYSLNDILSRLDGKSFLSMYQNKRPYINGTLYAGIPEFSLDDSIDLVPYLSQAGIQEAFTEYADFSRMLQNDSAIHIDSVRQKTHIEVDRNGTKAAAATDIGMKTSSVLTSRQDLYIILNQPFVYAIVETESGLPYFMGVQANLN